MSHGSLLRLAEQFRQSNEIGCALQCLQAALLKTQENSFNRAKTNLLIGALLLRYAKPKGEAKHYLMETIKATRQMDINDEKVREIYFRACSYLSDYYVQTDTTSIDAINILKHAMGNAKSSPYWHLRLILKLVRLKSGANEINRQKYLDVGAQLAAESSHPYLKILFMLSKSLDQLKNSAIEKEKFEQNMAQVENLTNQQSYLPNIQLNSIKLFTQSLQLSKILMLGEVKNAKAKLKELQQTVTLLSQDNAKIVYDPTKPLSSFLWISLEEMTPLVFLFTVLVNLYVGNMEKVAKYCEKTLSALDRISKKSPLVFKIKMLALEHLTQCRLVMGQSTESLSIIARMSKEMRRQPCYPQGQLHVLVGMYCMFNGEGGDARRHFDRAIQLEPRQNQLTTLCQLSSALVRMRESKNDQPVNLPKPTNLVLRAMVDIARGIDAIYKRDYALAKNSLRDGLKIANSQDLNGVTAITLLMLGFAFYRADGEGSSEEALNLAEPARKVAMKIPDASLTYLSARLLKQVKNDSSEYEKQVTEFKKRLQSQKASRCHYHNDLVKWHDGLPPLRDSKVEPNGEVVGNNNSVEIEKMEH